jgi:hypothetical protein
MRRQHLVEPDHADATGRESELISILDSAEM